MMRAPRNARTRPKALYLLVAGGICFTFLTLYWQRESLEIPDVLRPQPNANQLPCRSLAGAEDVLVSLKTGSTEIQDKLSVHLQTTLRCYPNHLIFSDYGEVLNGERILDTLEFVSPSIKATHDDFSLWRRLQAKGRAALAPEELSGVDSKEKDEDIRRQNPGWRLDKWKFLPMMNRTLHEDPTRHWYVFVEADTYILWSSLLPYLNTFSWKKDYYIGSDLMIEETPFAYGGAGFILSRSALEKVVAVFEGAQDKWEQFTDENSVGDHILGAALLAAGVPLLPAWPSLQGETVEQIHFNPPTEGPRLWCQPAISYHHESPAAIEDLWNFEQAQIAELGTTRPQPLRRMDIFEKYVLPRIQAPRSDWDNYSGDLKMTAASFRACEAMCEKDPACLQYALRDSGRCMTTTEPFVGEAAEGVQSGWMAERFQEYFDRMEGC